MKKLVILLSCVGVLCDWSIPPRSAAHQVSGAQISAVHSRGGSLSSQIDSLFGPNGIVLDVNPSDSAFAHTAHFTSSSLSTLGLLVGQLAPSAADFPALSTVPGFTYRYDPQLDEFTRSSSSLGPIFVERARTIGKGKFDLGFSYSFVDFEELNGQDLDQLTLTLQHGPSDVFAEETATIRFERFTLRSHVLSFFATYGITERWDVNVLLPVVFTSLNIRARARLDNRVTQIVRDDGTIIEGPFHFFDEDLGIAEQTFSAKDDKTGVGDLLLRTKYHLIASDIFNLAPGFVLRIPTGDEDNFQGLGDTTLNSFIALSGEYGRFHTHANTGIELNFDDSDRSRIRYAAGITLQLIEQLAFSLDVIGSSNVTTDRISIDVPEFGDGAFETSPPSPSGFTQVSRNLSTDIIDLSLGFKLSLFKSVIGFVNFFVPLNTDGLRSDFIPTAGFEVSF